MSSSSSFVAPTAPAPAPSAFDFVSSDFDALSSHMAQCSAAHGRWSAVKSRLQQAHAIASGHIVTVTCIAVATVVVLVTFA